MAKETGFIIKGSVTETLPNAIFRVKLDDGPIILGHLSGRMRTNNITIILGDAVDIEMSPYDLTKGRIVFRHK